jgi:hypothetical protein
VTALYRAACTLPAFDGGLLAAVDTETTHWDEPRTDPGRKTRFDPFVPGKLVLGSIAYNSKYWTDSKGELRVYHKADLCRMVRELLEDRFHLTFHNVAYDWPVLVTADPSLEPLLRAAAEEGRIHDSLILEQLIQIARGSMAVDEKVIRYVSLSDLAKRRAGMTLHKDNETSDGLVVRTTFDRFLDPSSRVPPEYLEYAAKDAEATYRVFISQWKEAQVYANDTADCEYPIFSDARRRFGLLSESLQVRGAVSLRWLEGFPLRVDRGKVEELSGKLRGEYGQLQDLLLSFGWAKRTKGGKFSIKTAPLRAALSAYCEPLGITPERTASGRHVTLKHDYWASILPRRSIGELLEGNGGADLHGGGREALEHRAAVWMRYSRVQKLLGTYLNVYSTSDAHYPSYHLLGARTGRLSCVRPNVQNIPKHRDGIRALFVPRPGHVLIEGDYKSAELVSLAQIFHSKYGGSRLGATLNAGKDPHIETARLIVGDKWDSLSDEERARMRQASKAANFGFPGGLGARRFVDYAWKGYGVRLTLPEAQAIRSGLIQGDDALRAYLSDSGNIESKMALAAKNLGLPLRDLLGRLRAWRDEDADEVHWRLAWKRLRAWSNGDTRFQIPSRPGFKPQFDLFRSKTATLTGRIRGRASYTEAHNTPFQGLIADAIKLAVWNLYTAPPGPWAPVCTVHDSILIEAREDAYDASAALLKDCMLRAFRETCPDIAGGVDVSGPLLAWGKNTDAQGNKITEEAPCAAEGPSR